MILPRPHLSWVVASLATQLVAGALAAQPPAAEIALPAARSPADGLASLQVAPGLQVKLVACEPLIQDPVAFDWSPDGRLWVAEMGDYPNADSGGRILTLADEDGDGRYDVSQVFLAGIPFPTGVKWWRDGVLITAAPRIVWARDTTGDGRADRVESIYEGFVEGNQQHRVNGLRWGLDNWLHLANGDSGGAIRSVRTGATVDIRGRDLRVRPDTGELDATSGQSQFGTCRDDWGNWFGGNNSNPIWHYGLRDEHLRRNPQVAPPPVRRSIAAQPGAAPVHPRSRTLERFNDFDKANRFTSACSPLIYRDTRLGPEYYEQVFVCEPVHNLVHREKLSRAGTTFHCERPASEGESEFLASDDPWFRPVMIRTGPDGALFVADMYRLVIEHPKWIPEVWQQRLDLRSGSDRGRIYRIDIAGTAPPPIPRLDRQTPAEWAAALDGPHGTLRDLAHQMLFWHGADEPAMEALARIVGQGSDAGAVHALSILEAWQRLTASQLASVIGRRGHPGARQFAVRMAGQWLAEQPPTDPPRDDVRALERVVAERAEDPDGLVRLEVAEALRSVAPELAAAPLARMINQDDDYLATAALCSISASNAEAVLRAALPDAADPERLGALLRIARQQKLATMIARVVDEAAEAAALELTRVAAAPRPSDAPPSDAPPSLAAVARLQGLLEAVGRAELASSVEPLQAVGQAALSVARNARLPAATRLAAAGLLNRPFVDASEAAATWIDWLRPQSSPQFQEAAADGLTRLGDSAMRRLLGRWSGLSPRIRSRILDRMLATERGAELLLEAVSEATILAADIDARRRDQLRRHEPRSAAARAARQQLLAPSQSTRDEVVQQYATALELRGDRERGRGAFGKQCAACHRLEGQGAAIGPDLAALTDNSGRAMLIAILDPNRAVEDKFVSYLVETVEGERLTGILFEETANSITLAGSDGKQRRLLRSEVAQIASSGKSLMPEQMERDLAPQTLADVIAYVRGAGPPPKQFAGNRPQCARPELDGGLYLTAETARIYGPKVVFEPRYGNLGWWQSESDRAVWELESPGGEYLVRLEYACAPGNAGNAFEFRVGGGQLLQGVVASTGSWDSYHSVSLGRVRLPAGRAEATFRSAGPIRGALLDLKTIRLSPAK